MRNGQVCVTPVGKLDLRNQKIEKKKLRGIINIFTSLEILLISSQVFITVK